MYGSSDLKSLKNILPTTLGADVTNFTHITTENSGHYIQVEEPQLVLDAITTLLD
ncbi:hypothetical protein [Spongiimicrobium sp. 3-5]|uniref:hypothetical protein n=1 Tax=Spongiimicrobium sp. 3-5 TaxID=3332596 RepID=UPI00397EDA26